MDDKIAVFLKDGDTEDSSPASMTILVFEKNSREWKEVDRSYVNLSADMDLYGLRETIRKMISALGDCRIAAGAQISGVVYRELDSHGFSIFEIEECSPETLDGILHDIEQANTIEPIGLPMQKRPVATEAQGIYLLDLIKLGKECPEVSSKQALKEFLETTPFYELRLVCMHIPPWLITGPYDITAETSSDGVITAIIQKKQCKGS